MGLLGVEVVPLSVRRSRLAHGYWPRPADLPGKQALRTRNPGRCCRFFRARMVLCKLYKPAAPAVVFPPRGHSHLNYRADAWLGRDCRCRRFFGYADCFFASCHNPWPRSGCVACLLYPISAGEIAGRNDPTQATMEGPEHEACATMAEAAAIAAASGAAGRTGRLDPDE